MKQDGIVVEERGTPPQRFQMMEFLILKITHSIQPHCFGEQCGAAILFPKTMTSA